VTSPFERRLYPRVPTAGRSGVLEISSARRRSARQKVGVLDISHEGACCTGAGGDLAPGTRVRLTLPSRRLFGRRVRIEGTVVRVDFGQSMYGIRFAAVRPRAAIAQYVERAGRIAHVHAGRGPAYGWAVARALRLLATDLQAEQNAAPRVLVVTSPAPAEGKSFLAAGIAVELARGGTPVLLVDADLHKPSIHATFAVSGTPGVAQMLSRPESTPIDTCLRPTPLGVTVLPAGAAGIGATLTRATGEAFARGLRTLPFSTIVIDTPPVLAAAETLMLAGAADDVILTVRSGHTRERDLRRAVDLLTRHHAPLRGMVLNDYRDPTRLEPGPGKKEGLEYAGSLQLDAPTAAVTAAPGVRPAGA
jgi:Mrp family chromosome partitioning ATPase